VVGKRHAKRGTEEFPDVSRRAHTALTGKEKRGNEDFHRGKKVKVGGAPEEALAEGHRNIKRLNI